MSPIDPTAGAPDLGPLPRPGASDSVVTLLERALAQTAPDRVSSDDRSSEASAPADPPSDNPWHALFYEQLRDQALPALIAEGTITPAASLWTGSRLWCDAFRQTDLQPGDRLVVALPPRAPFLQVLVAAIWEGLSVALLPAPADVAKAVEHLDARAAVASSPGAARWTPDGCAGPATTPDALRAPATASTPDVRFLLRTSGTTGLARWVALSDRNVLSVLASHVPHFRLRNGRVLSVLPWTHAFGLVLDLLPALLCGSEIIRDPSGGRDPDTLLSLSTAWGSTHLSAVPLTIQRLVDHPDGMGFLRQLQGGIVGGAPVAAPLAEVLGETQLRVGYGQTEASPGIALGAPGAWAANYLGRPLGCDVHLDADGEIHFQGPNACVGFWGEDGLDRRAPGRTVATGDLGTRDGDDLFFRGRTDDAFKLSNGKLVQAGAHEATLKEAFPELQDAFLFTHDGTNLTLALLPRTSASPPDPEALHSHLQSLAKRVHHVRVLDPASWQASKKGAVDRRAMARQLAGTDAEAGRSSPDAHDALSSSH